MRCPSCPTASGATRPVLGRGFLKLSDFIAFLDSNPQIGHVELSNYGEMFLHPQLADIMRCAFERGVELSANNGVNLNNAKPEVLEALVIYKFLSMTVSIDGASEESYQQYRVGGGYEAVIANIRKINELKKLHRSPYPRLHWQFIIFGHNEHEIEEARRMARQLNMGFSLKLAWGDFSPVRDRQRVASALRVAVSSRQEFQEKYGLDYTHRICHQLWEQPQINFDGKLLGCCRNFWGEFGPNVFAEGLDKSINGERMQHARAMLVGRAEPRDDVPCTTCEIYINMRRRGRWLEGEAGTESLPDVPTTIAQTSAQPSLVQLGLPTINKR